MKTQNLIDNVRNIQNLRKAWGMVRSNSARSLSNSIRQKALEYDKEIDKHLKRIQRQLSEDRFKFLPAYGLAKEDKPGKKRPIVIAPIDSRIVQRAILQTLQAIPSLKLLIETPTSCGGIAKRGVDYAIDKVYKKIMSDGNYFVRSDVKAFFTKISKESVISEIKKHTNDLRFHQLLENALDVVLSNSFELGEDAKLFPLSDMGVAQGSCLSPLMGNIILSEFDNALNSDDIVCLRYIDDFIIIGPSQKAVSAKLKKGLKILHTLGLDAYDPATTPEKAERGKSADGFTFLGCDIRPGLITPTKSSRQRLLLKIDQKINFSKMAMRNNKFLVPLGEKSFLETLSNIHNTTKAWGNQYQYCNNSQVMEHLDAQISEKIKDYTNFYLSIEREIEDIKVVEKRRLLGLHALADSKKSPIVVVKK